MGFLDRFKKEKETTSVGSKASRSASVSSKTKSPVKAEDKKEKKGEHTPVAPVSTPSTSQRPVTKKKSSLHPVSSEKSARLNTLNQYVFYVPETMTRIAVRNAVKVEYGVLPLRVNIQRGGGEYVQFKGIGGSRASWKKALVTLPKGKTIAVHEGV